jgi:hypothetical protein
MGKLVISLAKTIHRGRASSLPDSVVHKIVDAKEEIN